MWMACWWPRRMSVPGGRRSTGFADPARFTTEFYQAHVAGKPRMDGARATLEGLGVPDAAAQAAEYAEEEAGADRSADRRGQLRGLSGRGALRRCVATRPACGWRWRPRRRTSAAMLRHLSLPDGRPLLSIFDADLSGTDVPRGKPDPALFLLAAKALEVASSAVPGGGGRAVRHRRRARRRHGLGRHRTAWRRGPAARCRGRSGRHQPRSRRCGCRAPRCAARPARNGDVRSCMRRWCRHAIRAGS